MTVLAVTSPSIIPMELSYQHVIAVVSRLLRNHSRRAHLFKMHLRWLLHPASSVT